jgi:hypothetical protein
MRWSSDSPSPLSSCPATSGMANYLTTHSFEQQSELSTGSAVVWSEYVVLSRGAAKLDECRGQLQSGIPQGTRGMHLRTTPHDPSQRYLLSQFALISDNIPATRVWLVQPCGNSLISYRGRQLLSSEVQHSSSDELLLCFPVLQNLVLRVRHHVRRLVRRYLGGLCKVVVTLMCSLFASA